jgi:hypothetical protein
LAVWQQSDGTRFDNWSSRYVPASGWSAPEHLETDSGDARNVWIAIDSDGDAIATWSQSNGTRPIIRANRYVAGTGWNGATTIQTDASGEGSFPRVALDGHGNAMAVWHQTDGTRYNIWANHYVAGSGWSGARLIETDDTDSALYPQVGMDSGGNALVVWEQYDGTRYNIISARFASSSGWSTSAPIESDAGSATDPQIGVDPSGNAVAVWTQQGTARINVVANRYTPGAGWGTPTLIETDDTGDTQYPQIAINAAGIAQAVWMQNDGTRFNVASNRYTPGSGWGSASLIESDNSGNAYNPQVAINASGVAQAVWMHFDGMRFNIWANRYE